MLVKDEGERKQGHPYAQWLNGIVDATGKRIGQLKEL